MRAGSAGIQLLKPAAGGIMAQLDLASEFECEMMRQAFGMRRCSSVRHSEIIG